MILLAIMVLILAEPVAARPLTMTDVNWAIMQANMRADIRQARRPVVCAPRKKGFRR